MYKMRTLFHTVTAQVIAKMTRGLQDCRLLTKVYVRSICSLIQQFNFNTVNTNSSFNFFHISFQRKVKIIQNLKDSNCVPANVNHTIVQRISVMRLAD